MTRPSHTPTWYALALAVLIGQWTTDLAAATSDWPEFWRGRFTAPETAVLDEAYARVVAGTPDAAVYAKAAAMLEPALNALAPTSDRSEMRRRGGAWMFLGELKYPQKDLSAVASAESAGLALIEAGVAPESLDLAEALVGHALTLSRLKQREPALELVRRGASICDKSCLEDVRSAALLNELGFVFRNLGEHDAALSYLQRALPLREKLLGPGDAATLASARLLAVEYEFKDRYGEALPLRQRVLAGAERDFAPQSRAVATALNDVANLYELLLQYENALPLVERALSITEARDTPTGDETVTALRRLAMLHVTMGHYTDALPLAQRMVEIDERVHGAEHQETANALWVVGSIQIKLFQLAAAEETLKRCIAIGEKLGDSIELARASVGLGSLYVGTSRYPEAETLIKRGLDIYGKVAGPEHPEAIGTLDNLGALYQQWGRYAEARPIFERAAELTEKVVGPNDPAMAFALRSLGLQYMAELDYGKALPMLERSLSIYEKVMGSDHPNTPVLMRDIGGLYVDTNRYADAAPLLERALEITERTTGPNSLDTALSLASLSHLYWTMGLYHEALAATERSLAIQEAALGDRNLITAGTLDTLGTGQQLMGNYPEALHWYQRSLDLRQAVLGANHPDVSISLNKLASVHKDRGEYAEALRLLQRSLDILERSVGPTHPRTAQALSELVLLDLQMSRPAEALPLARRSLEIMERAYGGGSLATTASLANLARVQRQLAANDEALALTRRAREISERIRGPDHPETARLLEQEAGIHADMGDHAGALAIYPRTLAVWEKTVGRDTPAVANNLTATALSLALTGKARDGIPLLLRADGIGTATQTPSICWTAESYLSISYRHLEHPMLAIFWGKQAVNTVQGVRAGLATLDKETQQSYLDAAKRQFYTYLSDLLIVQGRIPEAQAIMTLLKDEEYFDFVQRDASVNPASAELPLTGVEREANERFYVVRQRLAALGQEHKALLDKQQIGTATQAELERLASIDGDLQAATKAFDDFVAGLEQRLGGGAATVTSARQVTDELRSAQSLMAALDADGQHAASVQYVVSDERMHIIVTTSSIQLAHEVAVTPAELNARILKFREAVQNPFVDPRPLGRELHATLIAPVQSDLEAQHVDTLMLVLDDALRYVPFAALVSGDQYLVERYRLAIFTPGAESRLALKTDRPWSIAAMGMTRGVPELGLPALAAVVDELQGIVPGVLPGTILYDRAFDRGALQASLRTPVVHIASHFSFVPGSDQSFLLLGDGSKLTLRDVRLGMRFDNVELLTLSACDTATGGGRRENGAEVEGLGRLAQDKGARAVLATLWPVADRSTGLLMQEFYREHQQLKLDKAGALRGAQLAMLHGTVRTEPTPAARGAHSPSPLATTDLPRYRTDPSAPYAHPFFWAPFILMGNWL
jgi:CHAT domain-containing protein